MMNSVHIGHWDINYSGMYIKIQRVHFNDPSYINSYIINTTSNIIDKIYTNSMQCVSEYSIQSL